MLLAQISHTPASVLLLALRVALLLVLSALFLLSFLKWLRNPTAQCNFTFTLSNKEKCPPLIPVTYLHYFMAEFTALISLISGCDYPPQPSAAVTLGCVSPKVDSRSTFWPQSSVVPQQPKWPQPLQMNGRTGVFAWCPAWKHLHLFCFSTYLFRVFLSFVFYLWIVHSFFSKLFNHHHYSNKHQHFSLLPIKTCSLISVQK